jgi:hypothetical protein
MIMRLDCEKACISVPHQRLLSELDWYKINSHLCDWIKEFVVVWFVRVFASGVAAAWTGSRKWYSSGIMIGTSIILAVCQ